MQVTGTFPQLSDNYRPKKGQSRKNRSMTASMKGPAPKVAAPKGDLSQMRARARKRAHGE